MSVDRLDDDDTRAAALDAHASREADVRGTPDGTESRAEPRDRAACHADLRAEAAAEYRAYAIDRGCERDDNAEYDEEFGHDLEWTRSWLLYLYERGNADAEFYEISEDEANRIMQRIRRTVTGQA